MNSIPTTAGHVPGDSRDTALDAGTEDHYRRLLQLERDRNAQLEEVIRSSEREAESLRRELRICHDTNAGLGSEVAVKTYALAEAEQVAAASAQALLAHGLTLSKPAKRTPGSQPRWPAVILEVDATPESDPPGPDDIHSKPTPQTGKTK